MTSIRTFKLGTALVALLMVAVLGGPARAEFSERLSFEGRELIVHNLIGEIKVKGGGGSFDVLVNVQGRDGTPENIEVLADDGGTGKLTIRYPKGQSRFVYPRLGSRSSTSFSIDDGDQGWLSSLIGALTNKRIRVSGSGSGMEVWADVTINVPSGKSLKVYHGAGEIHADNVNGTLFLSTHSGAIQASGIDGELTADTGSGRVDVSDIRGNLLADTGSGGVSARNCEGDSIDIDTGSGGVKVEDIIARRLRIDTGSGGVTARRVEADSALIDTGSGSVTLELDRMGDGEFRIDTGSGGVKLRLPAGASADVRADTGSGGVHLDLEEPIKIRYKDRNEIAFTIGGGAARIVIDTGSGGIRITN